MPQHFQRPFEFLLTEQLTPEEERVVARIERLRALLIARGQEQVRHYNPDPRQLKDHLAGTISWNIIGTLASVPPYWGTFLYLCAEAHRSRTIFELGSCAGISGCYLASNQFCERFATVEGSPDLAAMAAANLAQVSDRGAVIAASFDDAMDDLLPSLPDKLDCVFIDGHHEGAARLHYAGRVTPFMRAGALMIWDDIQWSPDLWEAWLAFSKSPGAACAINTGRFGMVVWDEGTDQHGYHDLSAYAGYWGKGRPRHG